MVVSDLCLICQCCTYCLSVNAQRDQNLSLGQQAYAPAGPTSYGGK